MWSRQKYIHSGKSCYRAFMTITFNVPTTFTTGLWRMANNIKLLPTITDFCLYPEYGEASNFHLHGIIYFTNKLHFHSWINMLRHNIGFIKLSKDTGNLPSLLGWHLYCRKDQHLSKYTYPYTRLDKLTYNKIIKRYNPIMNP